MPMGIRCFLLPENGECGTAHSGGFSHLVRIGCSRMEFASSHDLVWDYRNSVVVFIGAYRGIRMAQVDHDWRVAQVPGMK